MANNIMNDSSVSNSKVSANLDQLVADRAELIAAVRSLTRWVGKGIADGGFNCVAPHFAEFDLHRAEDLLNRLSAVNFHFPRKS